VCPWLPERLDYYTDYSCSRYKVAALLVGGKRFAYHTMYLKRGRFKGENEVRSEVEIDTEEM
jgi:hypothetical protein